ncbi:c-type cytochrome [Bhargavaea beijingensis]|uniref:C-type cytochrome n=1 Tax=Bhargavaea beijingensis TaxID=426756 RepID=A0ABX9ZE37_9BACL|nr:c-type cytochrome [Bhargavaea beijingensis]MCW1928048.1 c-type cytochrome [Bhargavaea beijingensis]RSK34275.1 c-type cytochrome [Bhargavaea beijingensis]
MKRSTGLTFFALFAGALLIIGLLGFRLASEKNEGAETPQVEEVPAETAGVLHNPPSLEDVPEGPEGAAIMRGYELVNNTSEVLWSESATTEDGRERVNGLSCTSCHAGAGLEEDSSSLVGMAAAYPMYIGRSGDIVTLEERINGCMVRSMDGQPLEGEDLDAMVSYFKYISEGIPVGAEMPWRQKNSLDELPVPNVEDGEALYQQSCIACHAGDGSGIGSNNGPALWGPDSFNDGAGMSRLTKMAGYLQNNMPKGAEGTLTDQEAADLAAYILAQDRPEWSGHENDWPKGGRPNDIINKERREEIRNGTINWDEVLKPAEK